MKLVQWAKELLPWQMKAWYKSFMSLAIAAILAIIVGANGWAGVSNNWTEVMVLTLSAAGIAALLNEVRRSLSALGDYLRLQVRLKAIPIRRKSI